MSKIAVCVLLPSGHRQTVKCTPNTTILQIIEEVCNKQKLKAEEYDIKHHNKILDTNTIFRFSGLPNNAQLELTPTINIRKDSEVILAITLENGKRVMGNFEPNALLWDILMKLCPEDVQIDENPVIIYTRREIYGTELSSTTLRALGLRGGRAMLRLIHRKPEELKVQANVSATIPAKPVEEKPYHRTLIIEPSETNSNKNNEFSNETLQSIPAPVTENVVTSNIKERKLSGGNKRKLHESVEKELNVQSTLDKFVAKEEIIKQAPPESMEVDDSDVCSKESFDANDDNQFIFLGERNAMLFSLETAEVISSEDLPDDFFELTIEDAKVILKDIRRKRSEMENGPLLTSSLRNLEESKRQLGQLSKYKKSIIRVKFPDRTVLQGTFKLTETIGDVENFVKGYLENSNLNFHLFTTPPKSILTAESNLLETGCVPGALLHFGVDAKELSETYLRLDLYDKFTTKSVASLAASRMRQKSTRPNLEPDNENNIVEPIQNVDPYGPSTSSVDFASTSTTKDYKVKSKPEKVPKWFKHP